MLPKIGNIPKKASNKFFDIECWTKKSARAYVYLPQK